MIEVSLLGRVAVAVDGVPLTGEAAQRRRLALLALLSVPTPRPLSRDRAMLYLWPDSDTASARHLLSVAVHVLRRALGHEALLTTGDELSLQAEALRVDVAAFEEALRRGDHEEAVALYQGPFMDGFHAGAGPELEQWIDGERTRLERGYAQALEGAAAARREAGDRAGAVEAWRQRVLLDPYSSQGALGFMRALADAGDRASAIRHAGVHRQLLDAELGAAADPAVEALAEALRAEATTAPAPPVLVAAGAAAGGIPGEAATGAARTGSAPGGAAEADPGRAAPAPAPDGHQAALAMAQAPPHAVPPPAPPQARRRARRWREAALGILLLAITLYVIERWRAHSRESGGGRPLTVAVLPCENTSSEPGAEHLGDAIAIDILDALGAVHGIQLVSRTSSFAFRESRLRLSEIGDRLHAPWIVDCSVQASAGRLLVSAQLNYAPDDNRTWHRRWDGSSGAFAAIPDEIARGIATALNVPVEPGPLAEGGTQNYEAYKLFQAGERAWDERTPASLQEAARYYRGALALDSAYARAWAGLALTLEVQGSYDYGALPPDSAFPLAREAALRAAALAPRLGAARLALAGFSMNYDWKLGDAEREFRGAIELDPGNSPARQWHALMLVAQHRDSTALAEMMRAGESEPNSAAQFVQMGHLFYYTRQYERALEQAGRALAVDGAFPRAYMLTAMALIQLGRPDSAAGILERLRARAPEPTIVGVLGYAYARGGRREKALECRAWLERAATRRYVPAELLVLVDVGLGERERALAGLEEAYRRRSNGMIYLSVEPAMDPLRSEPRFARLVRDVTRGREPSPSPTIVQRVRALP